MAVPVFRRPDLRPRALAFACLGVAVVGAVIAAWPTEQGAPVPVRAASPMAEGGDLKTRFAQGVLLLHMHQYREALVSFHGVLELAPSLPEAHVNMGFALIGLQRWADARGFFESAIDLRAEQANAYYGLATVLDELGDRPGAVGAMRTFLHRAPPDDPFRAKAEAALWEWQGESAAPTAGEGRSH